MRDRSAVVVLAFLCAGAFGQTYTIGTIAGPGWPVNIPGTSAGLRDPRSVAVDGSGNVFFADSIYNVVLRRDAATGMLTLAAGSWVGGYSGDDGPAARAQLNSPAGIAVDGAGNLYIADRGNYRVRKVSKGIITTVAGSGTYTLGNAYIGDGGPATEAQIAPAAVAVDGSGSLFIADLQNGRIRKVSNGVITTVAGNGSFDPSGDGGSATSAGMAPGGVAVDSAGNIYLLDGQNHNVRAISNGVITTVASGLYPPEGIAVDAADNLFVADPTHVRKASNGVTTTVVGNGSLGNAGDGGPATAASIWPSGLAVDIYGNIYLAEEYNYKIRMVSNGVINTIVGSGSPCCYIGDDGPATAAQFGNVGSIALSSTGDLYLADTFLDRIRKVSNGIITTVATGAAGPVTIDAWENIFFAHNYQVFRLSNGTITTVAGSGIRGFGGDGGPATSAQLCGPVGLAVDAGGQLYIADAGANRVRKVSNGVIATVAGSGSSNCSQTGTYSGDNGPATSAGLNQPAGVAVDSAGNLYIADLMNNAVRKVSNGIITTIAGNGTQGFSGDNGLATSAQMNNPGALAIDSAGSLYISDFGNARMRKVQNGVITTIAGGGSGRGDGVPSTGVRIATAGVAVDAAGNVYFAEPYSPASDVRVLVPAGPRCTASSVSPLAISVPGSGGGFEVAIQAGFLCDWAAQGAPDWITLSSGVGIGSSILTMSVAANYGPPRFASFSVAGMDVVVTQKAPLRIVRREPGPPGPRWPRR